MNKKDKIIYNCLSILDGSQKYNDDLLQDLEKFAKDYHVKIKQKKYNIKKYDALKKFVKNDEGYQATIQRLYNVFK